MTRNTLNHCLKFPLCFIFHNICNGKSEAKIFSMVIKVKLLVSKASNSCFKSFVIIYHLLPTKGSRGVQHVGVVEYGASKYFTSGSIFFYFMHFSEIFEEMHLDGKSRIRYSPRNNLVRHTFSLKWLWTTVVVLSGSIVSHFILSMALLAKNVGMLCNQCWGHLMKLLVTLSLSSSWHLYSTLDFILVTDAKRNQHCNYNSILQPLFCTFFCQNIFKLSLFNFCKTSCKFWEIDIKPLNSLLEFTFMELHVKLIHVDIGLWAVIADNNGLYHENEMN